MLYYVDKDECLFIEVPKAIQHALIVQAHESELMHLGRDNTYQYIKSKFHFQSLATQVYNYVDNCVPCQTRNLKSLTTPLQEMKHPRFCFQKIAIDTCGPYTESINGNKYVVTIIDMLSGFVECHAVPDKRATTIASILVNEIFNRYSWPHEILSDHGSEYQNAILEEITNLGHIHHIKSAVYRPQSSGRVERSHQTMISCLSKVAKRYDLDSYISSSCSALNSSKSGTIKYTPYSLLFHREAILPADTILVMTIFPMHLKPCTEHIV